MNELLTVLVVAHLLGDFYFQSERVAAGKNRRAGSFIIHIIVYWGACLLAMASFWGNGAFAVSLAVAGAHLAVDLTKVAVVHSIGRIAGRSRDSDGAIGRKAYVVDQVAHAACLVVVAYVATFRYGFILRPTVAVATVTGNIGMDWTKTLALVTMALFVGKPSNVTVRMLLADYRPTVEGEDSSTVQRSGRFIGTLERLILLVFLCLHQVAAMGLVLTAKSIARYDMIARNKAFAEYYLLGTLLSTLCVVGSYLPFASLL